MASVIGVDIAKQTFDIATLQDNGKYRTKAKLPNNLNGFALLDQWLIKHAEPKAWVVMEATSIYHEALALWLFEHGYHVCVLNPAQPAFYARSQLQRVKTDKVDAKLLADYGRRHLTELRSWQPKAPEISRLHALVRRLKDLQELEQIERNRLQASTDETVRESIQAVLAFVMRQKDETLKAIKEHFDDNDDLRSKRDLLASIDGIADRTAALLLAELGDIARFKSSKSVAAFAGLNPRLQESGSHKGHVQISRTGSASLRAGLYMPAIVAIKHNQAIREMAARLKANGKTGKQVVCAAMRKLLCIAYGVLKSGKPYEPHLALAR